MRTVPGGAIAWRRSIFEDCRKWKAGELIDSAVDIAWETLYSEDVEEPNNATRYFNVHAITAGLDVASAEEKKRPDMVIRRSGSFIVFSLRSDITPQFLNQAA